MKKRVVLSIMFGCFAVIGLWSGIWYLSSFIKDFNIYVGAFIPIDFVKIIFIIFSAFCSATLSIINIIKLWKNEIMSVKYYYTDFKKAQKERQEKSKEKKINDLRKKIEQLKNK